jgi:hypothetical protein
MSTRRVVVGVALVSVVALATAVVSIAAAGGETSHRPSDFTSVDPEPANDSPDELLELIDQRVHAWGEELDVSSMSDRDIEWGIDLVREAAATNERGWAITWELMERVTLMCESLGPSHIYRGELCSG